jgi:alpha-glucosidase
VAYPTEGIFGCGEQFSKLNLKGNNVPLWCQEQGIGRGDPKWFTFLANLFAGVGGSWYTTYHPQPTFVSTESYFVHSTHTSYSEIDFSKRENTTLYTWEIPKDIFIGVLDNVENTVGAVSKLIGRQPELPEWAYDGFWIAIQKGSNAVRARLQKALDKGVKVGGIWSQDWEGIRKTAFGTQLMWNWEYSKELFPDIQEFIAELNTKGIKFLGYINSFLALEGNLYAEAKEKNYCVKDKEGNDYYVYVTTFPAAIVDLTNPDAFEWIKGVMKKNMIEVGLTGWMSDFGEYLPPDAVLFSGEDAAIVHNKFPVLWQKANYEALQEAGKLGEIIFFTRAGYSGTSKYSTLIWAGDQLPTWSIDDGLASVIVAGQSIGVSGVGYYHSDVGGYTTFGPFKRTKELFMRWAEHSAFTMVMRSHEGNRPEANWQFDSDDESLEHLAKMTAIYTAMKPYMIAISKEYQEIGLPAMRAMFIHYSKDSEVLNLKYQYLFGKDLLVAPVYKKGKKSVKVYIPENGTWVHLWSDKEMVKGYAEIDAPIGQPPVFYRKDSKFADLFKSLKDL